jgi:hypothetical protein
VAVAVVDLFEAIEVERHQRAVFVVPVGLGEPPG